MSPGPCPVFSRPAAVSISPARHARTDRRGSRRSQDDVRISPAVLQAFRGCLRHPHDGCADRCVGHFAPNGGTVMKATHWIIAAAALTLVQDKGLNGPPNRTIRTPKKAHPQVVTTWPWWPASARRQALAVTEFNARGTSSTA